MTTYSAVAWWVKKNCDEKFYWNKLYFSPIDIFVQNLMLQAAFIFSVWKDENTSTRTYNKSYKIAYKIFTLYLRIMLLLICFLLWLFIVWHKVTLAGIFTAKCKGKYCITNTHMCPISIYWIIITAFRCNISQGMWTSNCSAIGFFSSWTSFKIIEKFYCTPENREGKFYIRDGRSDICLNSPLWKHLNNRKPFNKSTNRQEIR